MPDESKDYARLDRELADARHHQRLYRALFENSLGLMCVHDLQGTLLTVNPAAAASLGFRPEEGVGVNMKYFLAPEVRPLFDQYLDRIIRNGSDSGLMRLRARDGSERVWLYRNVLYEEPGETPRVLGHAQDITERAQAERSLKESERRFRTMADTAPVMIWMTDTDGKCVFVNRSWLDFSGRTLEQELGDGWAEGFHPEDLEQCVMSYLEAMDLKRSFRAECRVRRADGQYRWMLETGAPRFDDHGCFTGYIGTCLDVTENRQHQEALRSARDELAARVAERTAELQTANDALRESEEHYQTLAELSPVGIFRLDQGGRCRYVNERLCQILGITAEDLGEGTPDRLVHPDDQDEVRQEWRNVLAGRAQTSIEHRFLHRDGSTIWALVHWAAETGPNGQVTGCIGTVADISQRKRAEEEHRQLEAQVQHAQRLQSLGLLAGGLAHDFNNLLTIIMGNARMALVELPSGSRAVDNLAEIETASSRAAELTGQMLAYSGKGRFTVQAVNLSLLTEEIAQLLQAIISKKTSIEFALPAGLPAIEADPAQMRQVVMNLITNAAEAIGDQVGVIRLRTGVFHADRAFLRDTYFDDGLPEGGYVFLEVSDTGCGMSEETKARIFDPFFTTKFTGRGLGLAAVLGIVRAHRGALKVTSQPGAGSRFRLLFPCSAKPVQPRPEPPAASPGWHGRGTVLVVDDEPGVRQIARLILEKSGFRVLTAADGAEAVRVFRDHAGEITAIVLDMTMPVMSGEDTYAELRSIGAGAPVILCSGYTEQEVAGRLAGQSLNGFLQKPYEPADLIGALQKVLEQKVMHQKL